MIEAPDVSARSDSGSNSSLRNESLVTLGREAGAATVGLGSTEPAAERATGRSERSSGVACAKTVVAPPEAPASSDGGSGSPGEREVVEMSTAGATDSQAHRLVASEPGGTEAADPAGGVYAVRLGVIERQRVEQEHAASSTGSGVGRRRCFG